MAAFYATKGWYESKTVWVGIISALMGVLALFGIVLPVDPTTLVTTAYPVALLVFGALATLFRFKATTTLTKSATNVTPVVTPTV